MAQLVGRLLKEGMADAEDGDVTGRWAPGAAARGGVCALSTIALRPSFLQESSRCLLSFFFVSDHGNAVPWNPKFPSNMIVLEL